MIRYRTLLVAFSLGLLSVTLGLGFIAWRGANVAMVANERTQLAHQVLDGLLRIRVDVNRLLTDLSVAALTDGELGLTEARAVQRIRAELRELRPRIAREVALIESHEDRSAESVELDRLQQVEQSIEAIVREFDAAATLLATARRPEVAERIRAAVDKRDDGQSVAGAFRRAIEAAIVDEEDDVRRANALARAALERSALATQVATVAALALTLLGLLVLLERLRRPLDRLSRSVGAVARGDLSTRVALGGDDEFAAVGRAIDHMLDELQSNRARLQAAQADLERQVAERTAALSEANDALRRADELRRRFLADISHELRTPLTIIRGEGEVALRGRSMEPDEYRLTLSRMVDQARHTARLVDDLLFIARTDADQLRMNDELVQFDRLVHDACAEARSLAQDGRSIICRAPAAGVRVRGDPVRLRQLLHVLLDNALRYGAPSEPIEVRLETGAEGAELQVSDRGCGIPEHDLPHVFERFYRGANAAARHHDGSGLGLPMAKAIAEAHRGSISLRSVAGSGTAVTLRLPQLEPVQPRAEVADA